MAPALQLLSICNCDSEKNQEGKRRLMFLKGCQALVSNMVKDKKDQKGKIASLVTSDSFP